MFRFPSNKKPIELRKIEFQNSKIIDYPKNIRVPNVGENIFFDIWSQGTVTNITNKLEDGFFITTIHVN